MSSRDIFAHANVLALSVQKQATTLKEMDSRGRTESVEAPRSYLFTTVHSSETGYFSLDCLSEISKHAIHACALLRRKVYMYLSKCVGNGKIRRLSAHELSGPLNIDRRHASSTVSKLLHEQRSIPRTELPS